MTPDVNVLVAASRQDHPHHAAAFAWMAEALSAAGVRFTLLPMVTAGFLRVATHPRVFSQPTPTDLALQFVEALLAQPGVAVLELGSEWPAIAKLCAKHPVAGGDFSDVWIAAAVLTHKEHLVTFDRGFRRWLPKGRVTVLRAA